MKQGILSRSAIITALLFSIFWVGQTNLLAKDVWLEVRSNNFQIVGNASEKQLRRVAVKLEQFRHIFTNIFERMKFNSPVPTRVVVFKDEGDFRNFKPVDNGKRRDWVAGFFQPGEDVNYIVLSAEKVEEDTYRIIFHEYTHLLINNTLGQSRVPPWFNEGMAEYYELFKIKDNRSVTLGGLNPGHLNLLKNSRLIPFERFFEINLLSLNEQSDDGVGIYYAQAWALMHYLIQGNDGRRKPQMTQFLDLILTGESPETAFTKAFKTDYKSLQTELEAYLNLRRFPTTLVTFKEDLVFETEINSKFLTEAEAKSFQADLLFRLDRPAEAETVAKEALDLDPDLSRGNTILGLIKMKSGDFVSAKKYLKRAVVSDDRDFWAHYNYAYAISREKMSEDGFVLSYDQTSFGEMRRSLNRAVELNPNFAEAYHLWAFIIIVNNTDLEEALELLTRALKISPGNQWYSLRIGEIYLRQKKFENARTRVRQIFENAADEKIRDYARNTLNKINEYEDQVEKIKIFNEQNAISNPYLIQPGESVTPEDLEKLKQRIEIDSINANIRKLRSGEKRILGNISAIDCRAGGVVFKVTTGDGEFEFKNRDFQKITFLTYNVELKGGEIGCETNVEDVFSIITYRKIEAGIDKNITGTVVAVEFVPDHFRFSKENEPPK